jgi:hypothetical protein
LNPSSCATARATLDFPAPAGPSIATTIGYETSAATSSANPG